MRLISDSMIDRYLVKAVDVRIHSKNTSYPTILRYTGTTVVDTHEIEVGFTYPDGNEETALIYLPSVRDDGMLRRFRSTWYPVNLVIPPLCYIDKTNGRKMYAQSLLNLQPDAERLSDFIPEYGPSKPMRMTPLMKELYDAKGKDIDDVWNWIVLDPVLAVIEMFNYKIQQDIQRSTRPGFSGITTVSRALSVLLRAYLRSFWHDSSELDSGQTNRKGYSAPGEVYEELVLGPVSTEDKYGSLVISPVIKQVDMVPEQPIDFCSGSVSHPMVSAKLKDGVHVENGRFQGTVQFPYTTWRRAIVGITSDDPHRVIVSRSISRAMSLSNPTEQYASTDVKLDVDSVSLPGVRMTHPLNFQDGIVVSKTFAEHMGAYRVSVEKCIVTPGTDIVVHVSKFDHLMSWKDAAKKAAESSKSKFDHSFVIRPGDRLATLVYYGTDGEMKTNSITAVVASPAILLDIDLIEVPYDAGGTVTTYRFVMGSFLPLTHGDKVSDAHGNKATVSAVLDDKQMPVWETTRCHYIATPYIAKRMAFGAEIEDLLALIGVHSGSEVQVDSYDPPSFEATWEYFMEQTKEYPDMKYTGTVSYGGETFEDIPISYRTMYRLNNNSIDIVRSKNDVDVSYAEKWRGARNTRLSIDVVVCLAQGAFNLVNWLTSKSNLGGYVREFMIPILHSLLSQTPPGAKTYKVTRKLDRTVPGRPLYCELVQELDFDETVLDSRSSDHYGVITYQGTTVVIPPHEPWVDLSNGTVIPNNLAVVANRIVAEVESENRVQRIGPEFTTSVPDVERRIRQYHSYLRALVNGKTGITRRAVTPVFPSSIRAVATPFLSEDPFAVMIPKKKYERMLKSNSGVAAIYRSGTNRTVILKRDPIHRQNNFLAVTFKTWDRNVIGVSPLLIGGMDGDYDGDAVTVLFPDDPYAYADLEKLAVGFESMYVPSKQLSGVSAEDAYTELNRRVGLTSTFNNLHVTDEVKHQSTWNQLRNVEWIWTIERLALAAARDYSVIKDGTAICGATALGLLYMADPSDTDLLNNLMALYHVLAQDTLDAKAGIQSVPSLELVKLIGVPGASKRIMSILRDDLGVELDLKQFFVRLEKRMDGNQSIIALIDKLYPVLSCMQGSAFDRADQLAKVVTAGKLKPRGVWETMLCHVTDTRGTPLLDAMASRNE